ncbi:MAG: CRISPR-associated protein Cas4 [Nitrososphaeria archaeon]|nr:PD-(D/E)XK nuclease family protein [Conexivisphaerales archaeon]
MSKDPEEEKLERLLKDGLDSLWKKEKSEHQTTKGIYYPSYVGSCLRKQFYIYTAGESVTSEELVIFMTGKGVHELVVKAFGEKVRIESVEEKINLEFTDKIKLSGRIDIIIADIEGKKYLIEVKSASKTPDSPYESHVLQLHAYMQALKFDEGYLLYWNKRDGGIRVFKVIKNDEMMRKLYERVAMLDYYISINSPPPPESYQEGKTWECRKCPYLNLCNPGPL